MKAEEEMSRDAAELEGAKRSGSGSVEISSGSGFASPPSVWSLYTFVAPHLLPNPIVFYLSP